MEFLCLCNVSPSDFSQTLENFDWILVHRTFAIFFFLFFFFENLFLYLSTSSVSHCEMALKIYHSPSFYSSTVLTISHSKTSKIPITNVSVHYAQCISLLNNCLYRRCCYRSLFFASSMILECVSFMEFHFALFSHALCTSDKFYFLLWIRVSNAYNIRSLDFRHLSTWIFAIETSNAAVVLSFMKCVCALLLHSCRKHGPL